MIRPDYQSPALKRYHRIAKEDRAKGLTAHGYVRQRRSKLTPEERRKYGTAKFRLRTERLFEQGLTTRGTKRKRWHKHGHIRGEFAARVALAVQEAEENKRRATARALELLRRVAA